jgi:pyruvate,water dikinase
MDSHVIWFEDLTRGDVGRVGGKNSSLGEMVRNLAEKGIAVPGGFATSADAYRAYLAANELNALIDETMVALDEGRMTLQQAGAKIREAVFQGHWPDDIRAAIVEAYRELSKRAGKDEVSTAVRSSATAEDLPDASFAGQQETYLNIVGEAELLEACRHCYASLFTDRAITYRKIQGFDHRDVALSIGVQQMVRSDISGSGVMFSIDTESGFDQVVLINAAWGLGENVVQGAVTPDEYQVFKPFLGKKGLVPILEKHRGEKEKKMIYASGGDGPRRTCPPRRPSARPSC